MTTIDTSRENAAIDIPSTKPTGQAQQNGYQKVYDPRIKISLFKISQRKEVAEGINAKDRLQQVGIGNIEKWLGDQCTVNVTKNIKQPAGTFSITLSDNSEDVNLESIYGYVEPMDIIEIRMVHGAKSEQSSDLKVVMRGFVSNVSRSEVMGEDGKPQKRVTISGHDYGKIMQIVQIIYINNAVVGDNILHSYPFAEKYKMDIYSNPTAADFAKKACEQILKNFIELIPWGGLKTKSIITPFKTITPKCTAPGRVSSPFVNAWPGGGSLYQLLSLVLDVNNGFNELFMIDDDEDVKFVFRPTPYITPDGKLIPPANDVETKESEESEKVEADWFPEEPIITENDIISLNVTRTDAQTANFFWVKLPRFLLIDDGMMQMSAQPKPLEEVQNCNPNTFGIRMMQAVVNLGAPDGTVYSAPNDRAADYTMTEQKWQKLHRDILEKIGKDAVVFETGTMRLKGNEKIKAGGFITVQRRGVSWKCYAEQVSHDFNPYEGFYTTVNFTQGTGFIGRAQIDKPYLQEMSTTDAYGNANGNEVTAPDSPMLPQQNEIKSITESPLFNKANKSLDKWNIDEN